MLADHRYSSQRSVATSYIVRSYAVWLAILSHQQPSFTEKWKSAESMPVFWCRPVCL